MAIDKKRVVVVDTSKFYQKKPAEEKPGVISTKVSQVAEKKAAVVSRLATKMPHHTWRDDSRGMTFHHEVDKFAKKTKENFITLIITVVGMATALTWSEVVKYLIDTLFSDRSAFYVKLYVAIIATVFTLVVTYMISRMRESGQK